jgi:acetolactate synthase-1/2/3 large subunit
LVLKEIIKRFQPGHTREWCDLVLKWKQTHPLSYDRKVCSYIKPQFVIEELHRLTEGKAIVTTDVGQHQMWAAQYYPLKSSRTLLTSGGLGTMGFGFPAALGAQVAFPGRTIICIAGDGSFQMNSQELATAVYYNLPVKVAIINNQYLGMVRQWQEIFYGARYSHSSMAGNPDFVRLAEAYGATGLRATNVEQVSSVIETALHTPGPVVIDFQVDPMENVLPMVAPDTSITEMITGGEKF